MRKTLAFTLAETLIVMGIIGVVAALTLPNLNSSTGDKEKVAKVKKIYSNLNDAFGRATAVYGAYDDWFVNDSTNDAKVKRIAERMTEFMKISKDCQSGSGCVSLSPGSIGIGLIMYNNKYSYILSDGTGLVFYYSGVGNINDNVGIDVDIDGVNKGQNKRGLDIFGFIAGKDGVEPQGVLGKDDNPLSFFAEGWTKWVVEIGNMDYLKADKNGKCKNNTSMVLDGISNVSCK